MNKNFVTQGKFQKNYTQYWFRWEAMIGDSEDYTYDSDAEIYQYILYKTLYQSIFKEYFAA